MATTTKSVAALIARVLLGLIYFVFGLNFFLHFIPMDAKQSEAASNFVGGLFGSGYFFPFLKGAEVILGLFLIIRLFVPLSVAALFPITLNIFLFHAFLEPGAMALSVLMLLLNLYLVWAYRDSFSPLFRAKSSVAA
ncbi:acyltransferase [Pseudochryseolinea flava]|uniref:acyltransferase n=1 Tax=Pseudochryseolinea flava TaxID=2059302 RepID=UPI0016255253|nr:acyltransferase [Pseudochryseolinea flava]